MEIGKAGLGEVGSGLPAQPSEGLGAPPSVDAPSGDPRVRGRVEPPLRAWAIRGCTATGNRVSGVSVVVCDTTNQRAVTLTPHARPWNG